MPPSRRHSRPTQYVGRRLRFFTARIRNTARLDPVQERVGKASENHSGLWVSPDGLKAPIDLLKGGGAEPGVLKVVVLGRLVQLMFGKSVKFGPVHSSQLGPSVPKHVGRWPARTWYRLPPRITAVGFLRPEALILLV